MILKLKKILLLSGLGLITIGAITPVVASCAKKINTEPTPEPIYNAAIVQSLFEQFIENYRVLGVSNNFDEYEVEEKISEFELEYEEYKRGTVDLPESEIYAAHAKWVKDKAALYDIVLVEWSNVENNRDVMRENTLVNGKYSDEIIYAANLQDDFFDQGAEDNKSFNEYVDDMVEYDSQNNSASLFPRSHGYTLRNASPINSRINAVAAKANLLSQTIDNYLKLNEQTNIFTYLASNSVDDIFEDEVMSYNSIGVKINHSKITSQIVGDNGNYIDSSNTAYRLLTPAAAAALFDYSYLEFNMDNDVRSFKPFDGTKILNSTRYNVSIALHVQSFDVADSRSSTLLTYNNYETLVSTFEYDVVVTDIENHFAVFKDNVERYESTDSQHQMNYYSLVGSRTAQTNIPTEISAEHGSDYLSNTLGYDSAVVSSIVKAFGFTFSNIKKNDRDSNGRLTETSKLDEESIKQFYYVSTTSTSSDQTQPTSFTERYGTNGNIDSVVGKWLTIDDADDAIRLQLKFASSTISNFGIEYNANNNVDFSNLKISEANIFLNSVLGEGVLQIGVKIESADDESPDNAPGSAAYVTLGVYIASTELVNNELQYSVIAPIGAHNNVDTTVSENSNIGSIEQYVTAHADNYNKLFFPLFLSATQAANNKLCADLLEPDNLAKHEKLIKFISTNNIENFTDKLDQLVTLNTTYYAVSISMVILYGIKAIFDAITIACSWYNPFALASAIIQFASDILSIVFLSLGIPRTGDTIDKLTTMSEIFHAYVDVSSGADGNNYGYTPIKSKYDAYNGQLKLFKDVTKSPVARINAAANVREYYNEFMALLCKNLFDFINDSIKKAIDIDPKFDGGFTWSVFGNTTAIAPLVINILLRIILLIFINVFTRVAGIALTMATRLVNQNFYSYSTFDGVGFALLGDDTTNHWIFRELAARMGEKYANIAEDVPAFAKFVGTVKPMMKISGIAGVILGIIDILFTVGYSIASSIIASDVNDMLGVLA